MARKRLKFNQAYKRDIKRLLFDILFSKKTFMELQNEHKKVNGRLFFTNLENFNFLITEGRNHEDVINNEKLDRIFDYLFDKFELINLEVVKKKEPKK